MKIPGSDLQDAQLMEIYEQYKQKQMGRQEVFDTLMLLIQQEFMKPDTEINHHRLDACIALLQEVDKRRFHHIVRQVETRRQKNRGAEKPRRWPLVKPVLALALGIVLLLGFGIGGRHVVWFRGMQDQDDQMYRIEGEDVTVGHPADAAESGETQVCSTEDFNEVCAFLGMAPPAPAWFPDGWKPYQYDAVKSPAEQIFSAFYQQDGNETLIVYSYMDIADMEHFTAFMPQDGEGEQIVLPNGQVAYYSTNMGDPLIVWTKGNIFSSISGPVSYDELLQMVLSIGE